MARALVKEIKDTRKNYIINGDMRIAQRNTSFAAIANGAYHLDRFRYDKVGAMVHTMSRDTDVPTLAQAGYLFQNSMRANLTTPDTAIAAGDYTIISQRIEGYNWANLAQKSFTLSFWVKATTPGTYCCAFVNGPGDRSYVAEYTINTTATWEYKTITVSASPVSGTWDYSNGIGVQVIFTLAGGTTFQTTAGTWQTGNFIATANQVNGVNTGATDFRLTGLCLNEGSAAIPFQLFGTSISGELAACQRYYEKSYALSTVVGTAGVGAGRCTEKTQIAIGAGTVSAVLQDTRFKISKRTIPTVVMYSITSGASGNIRNLSQSFDRSATAGDIGETGWAFINYGAGTAINSGDEITYHWSAEAEL